MYFITGNSKKFSELQVIIPSLVQLDIDLPEIQSTSAQEIIAAKLEAARQHHEGSFVVEDTGLYFDCLHGLPGPLIKWFLKEIGNQELASIAERLGNTQAKAITWIGYSPTATEQYFFEGRISGTIVPPVSTSGFGWDVIFQPEGQDKTFFDMAPAEKNAVSMRAIAGQQLVDFLHNQQV